MLGMADMFILCCKENSIYMLLVYNICILDAHPKFYKSISSAFSTTNHCPLSQRKRNPSTGMVPPVLSRFALPTMHTYSTVGICWGHDNAVTFLFKGEIMFFLFRWVLSFLLHGLDNFRTYFFIDFHPGCLVGGRKV